MVLQQVADHQNAPLRLGQLGETFGVGDGERERLLDEDVLAPRQRPLRQLGVLGGWGGNSHPVDIGVVEDLLQ